MNYNLNTVPEREIEKQFLDAMYRAGIEPRGDLNLTLDGKIHRFETANGKRGNSNGVYKIYGDGCPNGFFQDWHLGEPVKWIFNFEELKNDYPDIWRKSQTSEFKAQVQQKLKEREKQEAAERAENIKNARIEFDSAAMATDEHKYLQRKAVKAHGLKVKNNVLLVPLYDVDGHFQAYQRIFENGDKRLKAGTSYKGAFFVLGGHAIQDGDSVILSEGYATGATLYELLGDRYRVAMAVTCHNLYFVAKSIKSKYNVRLYISADDDRQTEQDKSINPGLDAAQKCVAEKVADGYIKPPFDNFDDDNATDWNDFFTSHGKDETTAELEKAIKALTVTTKENNKDVKDINILDFITTLDRNEKIERPEMIAGLFPRSKVSMIVSQPGGRKSWLELRIITALSIGETIIDGRDVVKRPYKSLTLCGEGGTDEPKLRFQDTDWPINKEYIKMIDLNEVIENDLSLTITNDDGQRNLERLIENLKPEIIFIDSLLAFSDKDENKGAEMHGLLKYAAKIAKRYNIAFVFIHHIRKRKINERKAALDLDEVIGTSYFARYIRQVIGLQPLKQIENNTSLDSINDEAILVKNLKSYERKFKMFTFELVDLGNYKTDMVFDFEPDIAQSTDNTSRVYDYICEKFDIGTEFTKKDISVLLGFLGISDKTLQRILRTLVDEKLLRTRGELRGTKYYLPEPKDAE